MLEGLKFSHFIEWMKIEVFIYTPSRERRRDRGQKRKMMGGENEKKEEIG